jgi:hypothetical protein
VNNRSFYLALFLALGVAVPVHVLDFPGSVPDFVAASGGGTLLDAKPAFSADGIYARLEGYGQKGRENYAMRNVTVDVLLPLSVLPFLLLLARRAAARGRRGRATRTLLLVMPIAYVAFDFAENAAVLALLSSFPERQVIIAALLPYLTVIKRAASMLALILPLTLLTIARIRPTPRSAGDTRLTTH